MDSLYRRCLKNKNIEFIDFNSLAEFFIEFSKAQAIYASSVLLHYCFPLILLEKIDYPRVLDLLLIISSPIHPEKNFNSDISENIWKWMRQHDFFDVLCMKLLYGLRVSERYFLGGLKPMEKSNAKYNPADPKMAAKEPVCILTEEERANHMLLEEKTAIKYDVDGIMDLINVPGANTTYKSDSQSNDDDSMTEEKLSEPKLRKAVASASTAGARRPPQEPHAQLQHEDQ